MYYRISFLILGLISFCAILSVDAPSVGASPVDASGSPATVLRLRCEYRVDPLGIDVTEPRLYWEMQDARRGAKQTAYQVLVASTPEKLAADQGDLWDSGRVESNRSTHVVYAGRPLLSRMQCHWKVRIWDADGQPTAYGKPALWTMGLLKPDDVKAKWIGVDGLPAYPGRASGAKLLTFKDCHWIWSADPGVDARDEAPEGERFFRKILILPEKRTIERAWFMVAADEKMELFINGKSAGSGAPVAGPRVFDVTKHLVAGKNCLAISVVHGKRSPAGLIGKLVVEYEQGEPMACPIDGSWKGALLTKKSWTEIGYNDSQWPSAVETAKAGEKPWESLAAPPLPYIQACPLLRKEFKVHGGDHGGIRRATLYGSALGNYRLFLNGKPVGNDYFTPGWTDYKKRVYYNTYDVTDLVRSDGQNAVGGVLAAGWYSGAVGWQSMRCHYGDKPRLLAQLEIELADGTVQTVVTDGSWKTAFGPYIEGEFLAGETYDARREIRDWASPAAAGDGLPKGDSPIFVERKLGQSPDHSVVGEWRPATVAGSIAARLQAFPCESVQETGELRPVKITEPEPGVFVFDLGQNFAGVARLKVRGQAGAKVVLRFAEVLNPDGTIYTTNLRDARVTDAYVLKGKGEEIWQPHFTFHGFRYVEVTGYPGRPAQDAVTGVVLNSNVPPAGSFECSSPMVNKLYQNILWTQRANFISVPTDCPQRDERLGWMGDAQTFVRAATYNADVSAFFTKWLVDVDDAQTPEGEFADVSPRIVDLDGGVAAWADAGVICPTTIYHVYNDRRLLEKHYPAMVRWVEYCRKHSKELLRPNDGYGDWLSIKKDDTPKDVIATAYFAHSTRLTADAARALGKKDDAKKYDKLFRRLKRAFNKAYVASDGRLKGDTQTCYVMALWFDLLPESKRKAAARRLVADIQSRKNHLSTGFVGTSALMPALSSVGQTPLAYKLLLNDTFPSWGFSIKHGATTIWERWDGWTPEKGFQDAGMNSFAHYSFGAVGRWMFQTIAGIDTAEPGFQKLSIHPQPAEGLCWVKAGYHSIHGPIASEWRVENGRLTLRVVIPANTTATVAIPTPDPSVVTEGGLPAAQSPGVKILPVEAGQSRFEVGAGEYQFVAPWKP